VGAVPDSGSDQGDTVVLGERELAIGFRLIGLKNVIDVTPETAVREFQRVMGDPRFNLVIASQSIRANLSETQRSNADSSLHPLVVFVPTPTGDFEVESVNALAKRVLGITLQVSN